MKNFNPYDNFGFLTIRIGRLIGEMTKDSIQEIGYNFPHSCIGILADLWQKDGVNQKELGLSLIKSKSSITKMLISLEKEKMIVRKDDPVDQRNKLIYLTDKGRAFQQWVIDAEKKMHHKLLKDFSKDQIKSSKKILIALYQNLFKEIKEQ